MVGELFLCVSWMPLFLFLPVGRGGCGEMAAAYAVRVAIAVAAAPVLRHGWVHHARVFVEVVSTRRCLDDEGDDLSPTGLENSVCMISQKAKMVTKLGFRRSVFGKGVRAKGRSQQCVVGNEGRKSNVGCVSTAMLGGGGAGEWSKQ